MSKSEGEELDEMDLDLSQANDAGSDVDTDNEDALLEEEEHYLEGGEDDLGDSSDDTEDDEEMEDKLLKQFQDILIAISKDTANYDFYVQLVETAHQISDLDKIRQSCELFSSAFPLAPEIWLRWLKIELNIAISENELKRVHQLFRRAFADYFCATLAAEYANLALKLPNSDDIWEDIVSTYALHCTKGRTLFEAWRTYINDTLPESSGKYSKLIESFEKELSIPLKDMEESYIEFKVLCEKQSEKFAGVDWTKIDERYHKAKEHLAVMLPFEAQLSGLSAKDHHERVETYAKYIDECKDTLDEPLIQILHERMVTDCCLNVSCWLRYIKYIQSRDDYAKTIEMTSSSIFSQTDWDIVNRALRNCTWSAELFIEKMFIAERMELPKQEVQIIVENAFVATVDSPQSFLSVWVEYITYLRRNTNFTDRAEVDNLRANLALGWETLEKQFADPYCELLKIWGRLEYGQLQNVSKGKELWHLVMESESNVNKAALWVEFALLELNKGVDAARKVFRKAVSTPSIDDIHIIISAWTRLERCHGTFDQLKSCQLQCKSALQKYNNAFYPKKQFQKRGAAGAKAPAKGNKMNPPPKAEKKSAKNSARPETGNNIAASNPLKRKQTSDPVEGNGTEKRKRTEPKSVLPEIPQEKDSMTVFISNLSYEITADEVISAFPELKIKSVNLVKSPNGRGRGFGYIELTEPSEVELALSLDRRLVNDRPAFISNVTRDKEQRGKFKYSEAMERTKLFVKGLPYDAAKEEVEKMFGAFGTLKDVRLVCHKNGKSKGIAYVEFEDESAASTALLKLDQLVLRNLTLSVSISDPPAKPKKESQSTAAGLGQGRRLNLNKGDQKPRMSFIPRAVQQNATAAPGAPAKERNSEASGAKSNDDFRKMLLK